jgi:hypothetical protein
MLYFPTPKTKKNDSLPELSISMSSNEKEKAVHGAECIESTMLLSDFLGLYDPAIELDAAISKSQESKVGETLIPRNIWKRPTKISLPIPNVTYAHDEAAKAVTCSPVMADTAHIQSLSGSIKRPSMAIKRHTGEPPKSTSIEIWYDVRPYITTSPDCDCPLLMMESKSLQPKTSDAYLKDILASLKLAEEYAALDHPDEESSLLKSTRRQLAEDEEEATTAGVLSKVLGSSVWSMNK